MIYIDTDINAPCCPCQIVDKATGKTILVQTDFDYPPFATVFGWSTTSVQKCQHCGKVQTTSDDTAIGSPVHFVCADCEGGDVDGRPALQTACQHDGTDGTVNCKKCGVTASDFISAAGDYLSSNDGKEADDPGYFQ